MRSVRIPRNFRHRRSRNSNPVAHIVAAPHWGDRSVCALLEFREISATGGRGILTLHRSNRHTCNEISLEPGVNHQDRHGGEHDRRHLDRLAHARGGEAFLGGDFLLGGVLQHVVQIQLNREQLFLLHIQQRIGETVPPAHGVEQGQRGQHRQGQGQINPHQRPDRAGAVDFRRLPQALGNPVEEGPHHDHVVHADAAGNHHTPDRIQHLQILHQQVVGNRAGAEIHGKKDQRVDGFSALQLIIGQGVGAAYRHEQAQQRAAHRQNGGKPQGMNVFRVPQDGLIGHQVPALRPEEHLVAHQGAGIGKRPGQHVQHGQQADKHDNQADGGDDPVPYPGGAGADHAVGLLHRFAAIGFLYDRHFGTSLHDPALAHPLGQGVGGEDEDHGHHALEQADSGRQRILQPLNALLIDVDGNQLGHIRHQFIAHGQRPVKFTAQDVAHAHDQQGDDRRPQARQRHVPDAAETAGAVHGGRLIQLGADIGQGGQIDDRPPSGLLPDAQHDVGPAPAAGVAQEGNHRAAVPRHLLVNQVQQTVIVRQQPGRQAGNDNPAQEVGQIQHRLGHLLEALEGQVVQQQGQQNRRREPADQIHQVQHDGVLQRVQEGLGLEGLFKPLKAHPRHLPQGLNNVIFLEGQGNPLHRVIPENCEKNDRQKQQQIQRPVPAHVNLP